MKNNILSQVEQNGYATVNVDNLYYYTVGLSKQGKQELIGFALYPFGLFQMAASLHHETTIAPNVAFTIPEFKVPGLGLEPARCKLSYLKIDTNAMIKQDLVGTFEGFEPLGYQLLLGPDLDNQVANEPDSLVHYDPDEFVMLFIAAVKTDLENANKNSEK